MKTRMLAGALSLIIGLFSAVFATAQVDLSPGVARLSLIHGDVSSQRGDTGDWAAAVLNQPIVSGDRISTGDRSRTEVQLDHANILRLGNNSQVVIASLTRTHIQVQVSDGLAFYSLFKDSDAKIEIDTPNVAVRPTSKEGLYRIEVTNGQTEVTVRKGAADISTPQGSARLEKGQAAIIRGSADQAEYKLTGASSKDTWDSWVTDRDGAIRNAQSWNHTNQYYVGSEDLDAYGRWISVPDYGLVWSPVVPVGWAPYRLGRWVWEPYWGWTWVSYEPWGWAPYHYGRWFPYGGSWVWWPGPVYRAYRPIWAPAYVSFFGFGGHWGVSFGFGFGSVGWLPIGPCDRYYPWWGHYRNHFNVVNITNVTNITNIYNDHDRHVYGGMAPLRTGNRYSNVRLASADDEVIRRAISTVPAEHFGTGHSAPVAANRDSLHDLRLLTGNVPIVPTKDAAKVSNRPADASTMRSDRQERFFTKSKPLPTPSFDRQAAQVEAAIKRNARLAPADVQADSANHRLSKTPASEKPNTDRQFGLHAETPTGEQAAQSRRGEWQRFGGEEAQNRSAENPAKRAPAATPAPAAQPRQDSERPQAHGTVQDSPDRYGWHRFSESTSGTGERAPQRQATDDHTTRPGGTNAAPSRSSGSAEHNEGWQQFTPRPGSTVSSPDRGGDRVNEERYRSSAPGEARGPRTYSTEGRAPNSEEVRRQSRPPLNLRQPIVTPRADRGMGRSQDGGGNRSGGSSRSESRGSSGSHGGGGGQSHSSTGNRSR